MEILVCIKQVPDDSVEISLNSETGKPALEEITQIVNAFDTYALEMATRMKEAVGGEVVVVSIGDESVKNSLKNCLAVGGDKAFLVKHENVEKLDAKGIAKVLVNAKDEIEGKLGVKFDMIFCGKEATDYATSQVGLMLADELKVPVVTNVVDVELKENLVDIKQEIDEGYNVIETSIPCVVTVQKPNYEPRYPTIKTKMQARKKPIEEISLEIEELNPVEIIKVYEPVKRSAGVKIKAETVEEAVSQAMKMMVEAKVL
ncbi:MULTISPECIES: electron transfer flavoprotein subunit beta/FixA family protein [Fusobacterium]|jgi:electron transfer flavoprotein alpha/beta subunit|uniref:Electron transfer flavoprotein subunit beta/FixA family protein n=1 Tax=Fusobacterium hominis TaxID=2764326 RepID=A0A7G9GWZ7_9FUSO|nr:MULTISPECIES: electron transfer flavoprotein subunit beta/FixA family protein [Fusobacterium]QNM15329.1 electron transfer flavoprotein subunit beta/FixA family protein [Fusobacterium hominis]